MGGGGLFSASYLVLSLSKHCQSRLRDHSAQARRLGTRKQRMGISPDFGGWHEVIKTD